MDEQTTNESVGTWLSSLERRVRHMLGSAHINRPSVTVIDWVHDAARNPVLARLGIDSDD
ncbi:hypothetical protein BSP109_02161 [Brevibacterium sp. Mu109]|uniref:hypothetical protein n=1 Tax=Brevibacterium sp. Mu109 TaxID=1255669 RepID=UPI000C5D4092|nr:hypothetical protein [Brevibacterium sp. Mu109]SMX86929.1 hypothetical protein BSP109_02161 [Brevibacterium sp. Mu109]